jgi:hypothetical protein
MTKILNKANFSALIFAIAIVLASIALSYAYMERNKGGNISVTGLGEADFTSDLIVWDGNFTKENTDLKVGSTDLEADRKIIEKYLLDKGIKKADMVFSAVSIREKTNEKYTAEGRFIGSDFEGFILTQSVQISSQEVEKVELLSRSISELLSQGIRFYSIDPRYYYTKLADLKIKLISEATEDARLRAEKISEKSGGDLGKLISAQMGIFQITGQNSAEEYSWGGTFNTANKEKSANITMKLTYEVE